MEQDRRDQGQVQELLANLYEKYRSHQDGEVATYIPELGKADPNSFGICVATVDGQVFEMGDCDQNFTTSRSLNR